MSLRYVDLEAALRASQALDVVAPSIAVPRQGPTFGLGCVPPSPGQTWRDGNAECHENITRALGVVKSALVSSDLPRARLALPAFARALGGHADAEEASAFKKIAAAGAEPEALAQALDDHGKFRRALVTIAALLDAGRVPQALFAVHALGDFLARHDELEQSVLYPALDALDVRAPTGLRGMAAIGDEPRTAVIQGISQPVSGPTPNPATFRRMRISPGSRGTNETLEKMAELAVEGSTDPWFVAFARGEVRECGSRDHLCEAAALLRWVKGHVPYRHDPQFMEWIQSPGWTAFVEGQGDCDDFAILIAAMALSVGLQAKFRAVALNKQNPTEYTHVYPMIEVPGKGWLAADAVPPTAKLGWEPPKEMWVMEPNDLVVSA
jgi:hypothetical protein